MKKYRIMPHGYNEQWWKVQTKFLFLWITVDSYRSKEVALETIQFLKEQEKLPCST